MAGVTYGSSSSGSIASGSSTLTISHTCASGARLVTFVAYDTSQTITSVTYNSVAMTSLGTTGGVSAYGIVAPSNGTYNVVVTMSGSLGANDEVIAINTSVTGADSTAPFLNFTSADSSDVSSVNITTTVPNSFIVGIARANNGNSISGVGASQTQTASVIQGSLNVRGSYRKVTTATTYAMDYSFSGGAQGQQAIIAIRPPNVTITNSDTCNATDSIKARRDRKITVTETSSPSDTVTTTALGTPWTDSSKNTTSWGNESKNSTSWGNESKNSSTWNNQSKS